MVIPDPDPPAVLGERLRTTVEFLCSDVCLPRLPGTPGGLAASRFVETEFGRIGLAPAGEDGYLQAIPGIGGANVIGVVPGASDRVIVVGAHFDACAIDGGINPGASDNAASVAVLLEVARNLVGEPLGRTVMFLGFDAEEPPYFQQHTMGSRHFVAHPTVDLGCIDLMVCLDMIGHAIGDGVDESLAGTMVVFGSEKSVEVTSVLSAAAPVKGLSVRRMDVDLIDQISDHAGFQDAGIPFLFYNALRNEHYHAVTDTPDTIDYGKVAAFATHLSEVVRVAASLPPTPFSYDPAARIDAESIRTIQALLPTLPPSSRFAVRAPALLDGLAERASDGLGEQDRLLLQRLFDAIEDGLLDARMWDEAVL